MMDIISVIFQNKKVDLDKLVAYGFEKREECYIHSRTLNETDFILTVSISLSGEVSTKIIDPALGEPYTLHLAEGAVGSFVGGIKTQYQEILTDIAENCFVPNVFQTDMAKQLIAYVRETYGDEPEFLWEKFAGNAVWRCKKNAKWYGILLTVSKEKLGIPSDELVEVIDLRLAPEELELLIDNQHYYPGYHMNKKHWYTMILDGSVSFEELCQRIQTSYLLASKKPPSAH